MSVPHNQVSRLCLIRHGRLPTIERSDMVPVRPLHGDWDRPGFAPGSLRSPKGAALARGYTRDPITCAIIQRLFETVNLDLKFSVEKGGRVW